MATLETVKMRLRLTIGLVNISAGMALPTGIPRIHFDNWDPRQCRLVGEKRLQLCKRPVAHQPSHFSAVTVRPVANPCEILNGDCLCRRIRGQNDLLGYD